MQNTDVARKLEELALLLESQTANLHRVRAYQRAAGIVQRLDRPVVELVAEAGAAGLQRLRGIGPTLARAIVMIVQTGRLPMLDRLRGQMEPQALLLSVPGVGRVIASRLVGELGITTLEELETAAHDGRLDTVLGLPAKTIRGIVDCLATRLSRVKNTICNPDIEEPPVAELLDVDQEYRRRAREGSVRTISPRRFNPLRLKWLPILRTSRGGREYTALFSNTGRAHQLERTGDWVILYYEIGEGLGGRQCTVVTETHGPLTGRRVVRGREAECERALAGSPPPGARIERDHAA